MKRYNERFLDWPIYRKLLALYDNYERNIDRPENHTDEKIAEERAYIDAIYNRSCIQMLKAFLVCKGMFYVRFTGVVLQPQKLTRAELWSPANLRWRGGGANIALHLSNL